MSATELPPFEDQAIPVTKTGLPAQRPAALLPGAFNPVHDGHWQLAEVAARLLGVPVAFELSTHNVDKPPLDAGAVERRLAQFRGKADVWLTAAPTFLQKARLFPGAVFVVGADTAARVVAVRYYADEAALARTIADFDALKCSFLVGARIDAAGRLLSADDLAMPTSWRRLFRAIDPADFRFDLSSTQLRNPS